MSSSGSPGDIDRRMEAMQRGRAAGMTRNYVLTFAQEEQNRILSEIDAQYRSHKLTHDTLMGMVGELSELRRLVGKLDTEIQRGQLAQEEAEHG